MKVKALKSIFVQRLRAVVAPGDEFDTSDSHGKELIAKGMAEFVADSDVKEEQKLSDYESGLIDEHTEELQEQVSIKSGEIITLTNSITEKEAEITELTAKVTEKDQRIAALETEGVAKDSEITDLKADINSKETEITELTVKISELQAAKESSSEKSDDKKSTDKGKKA